MKPAFALCYDYSTPFEDCARHARDAGFEVVSLFKELDVFTREAYSRATQLIQSVKEAR